MKYFSTHNIIRAIIIRFLVITMVGATMFASAHAAYAATFSVTTDFPSTVGTVYSTLNGYTVNNSGEEIVVWFEYGRNGNFEAATPKQRIGEGVSKNFSAHMYRLEYNVEYVYRAAARKQSGGGTEYGVTRTLVVRKANLGDGLAGSTAGSGNSGSFSNSSQSGPAITSDSSDVVATEDSLTLTGSVVTGGLPTAAWFEWGTTPALGNKTVPQTLPTDRNIAELTEVITGLAENTTYYYKLVSINELGSAETDITAVKTKGGGLFGGFGSGSSDDGSSSENDGGFSFGGTANGGNSGSQTGSQGGPFESSVGGSQSTTKASALGWGEVLQSQLFTIDERGRVFASQHAFGFDGAAQSGSLWANIFGLGGSILPNSLLGWVVWIVLTFVVIFQLRAAAARRARRQAEKQMREQELSELKRYQEAAGKMKKTA